MTFPFGVTVTLITRAVTGQDNYGNDIYGETTSTVVGAFAPAGSSELVQGQDTVIDRPTVYLPSGTDVSAVDAVQINGDRYQVVGTPNDWSSPFTGWAAGVEVRLEKVTG